MDLCNNFHSCFYFEQTLTVPCYLSHWQFHFCRTIWYLNKILWLLRSSRKNNSTESEIIARSLGDVKMTYVVLHFTFTNVFLTLSDFFFSEWIWYSAERYTLLRICRGITINFEFRLISCSKKLISQKYSKILIVTWFEIFRAFGYTHSTLWNTKKDSPNIEIVAFV